MNGGGSMAKSPRPDDSDFEQQNERAIREAREADRIEPRAHAAAYDPRKGLVLIELRSGFAFGFPPERVPGLESAEAHELSALRISPSGDGLLWDHLDVHVSLTGLVATALNLPEWAPRFMGQIRSEAKAKAARANGLKGGRPRRTKSARNAKGSAQR
jgi:hypothetical protein